MQQVRLDEECGQSVNPHALSSDEKFPLPLFDTKVGA